MRQLSCHLVDESATQSMGAMLAQLLRRQGQTRCLVLLQGDLGAGKSTLARGFLQGLGHRGAVPSPTYTLVEPYEFSDMMIYHLDLYRLGNADELEFLGIREILDAIALIEWPQRSPSLFDDADLVIDLVRENEGRSLNIIAKSDRGEQILVSLNRLNT